MSSKYFQIYILTIAICLNFVTTKVLEKQAARGISNSARQPLDSTSFDYDYFSPQARQSQTPTQRPFINYWNNLVQNIRLPVPYIRWNMTNPLVNLFNAGATNVIDTPVGNYNKRNTKRKRNKKTRTQQDMLTKRTKKPKYTNSAYEGEDEQMYQTTSYNDYEVPYKTLYFYDARTGQYYKMQNLHTNNYLSAYNPAKQQPQQPYEFEEEEGTAEQPVRHEVAAQIEPPTAEASVESNNSDDEAMQETSEEETLPDSQEAKESEEVEVIPPDIEISDESKEEPTLGRQSDLIKQTKQHKVKNIEKLHNSLAAYMKDDHFNRMRQRANTKLSSGAKQNKEKSLPRKKFAYYILQPF
ncbi:PREDICTED: uncharacterized protein LOC108366536 isoform X1 [Rhagoletis zephyria]|uniref:uncharacterized protein LOC108366536 isoform X1 n=1 Tax=Rhagoletis zephyria TaxID=28612 RepID=UPI00081194AC|nr:PREDICTED: uncharacterized protein LOC108366536 isoform X1 [Rhagoletis zephyria]